MLYFSVRVRELREGRHMTQAQLAQRIGVSRSVISGYETDIRIPNPSTLIRLAAVLGTTTDYLLCVDGKRMIDLSGLSDREVIAVCEMVAVLLENKNNGGQI